MTKHDARSNQPNFAARRFLRLVRVWPEWLVASGAVLYAAGCLNAERLPLAALFIGPGIMAAGILMIAGIGR